MWSRVWRRRVCGLAVLGAVAACHGRAQGTVPTGTEPAACKGDPALPSFEVASVVPVAPKDRGNTTIGQYGQPRFTMRGVSLGFLLSFAFDIRADNLLQAPKGLEDAVFDVQVESAGSEPLSYEALKPRMQQLLEQRFCLQAQPGTKQVPGYAMTVAKGGLKMQPVTRQERGSGTILQDEVRGTALDMNALAGMLASPAGRPVTDRTGVPGRFDVDLHFAPATDADATLPSVFTAVREQLGLELKPAPASVPTLTIARLRLEPSAN